MQMTDSICLETRQLRLGFAGYPRGILIRSVGLALGLFCRTCSFSYLFSLDHAVFSYLNSRNEQESFEERSNC